jgi:diacylglycerol kinase family enzyme
VACPADAEVVGSDRTLRDWVVAARERVEAIPEVGVAGGDLARTCGGGLGARPSAAKVTVDVMRITLDGNDRTWGVAHVVAHRGWWRGDVLMVMNAEYYGAYDVVPRSHPNDGRVDVVHVDPAMSIRQRWQARKRALTGAHLPHRHISVQSLTETDLHFAKPVIIWIDGVRYGAVRDLHVVVEPDALTIYV